MTPDGFLPAWHRAVAHTDLDAVRQLLADDVRLGSPPYWQRFEGKEVVHALLGFVLETFEDFRYHREWCEGRELALEFTARVGEQSLQGVDLITLDEAGRITNLDVVIRPADAIEALREAITPRMTDFLSRRAR